jgi:hypothetical protein
MSAVAVILPCYGRYMQTLEYAQRMVRKAGAVDAEWVAVGGQAQHETIHALIETRQWSGMTHTGKNLTYWQALEHATLGTQAPVLCAVANDVWAGDDWLELGLRAYHERFPDGQGLMGFAGDGHGPAHSCHFLIGRRLLEHLGGWPVHYRHNFGDTELCARAQALGRYAKATRAVLEHKHPLVTGAPDDTVYQAGRAGWSEDEALFRARQERGWA